MVISAILHWLVSQSIFLVRVVIYDSNAPQRQQGSITTCGYSSIALIFTIIVGALSMAFVLGAGLQPLRPGMPVVGVCSAVISAACHLPDGNDGAELKPLKWGAVKSADGKASVSHCCFTSQEVDELAPGNTYA